MKFRVSKLFEPTIRRCWHDFIKYGKYGSAILSANIRESGNIFFKLFWQLLISMFKMTINGVALSILISCLLSLGLALPAGETCGTVHPSQPVTSNRAIPTCGLHECDDPTVRYVKKPIYTPVYHFKVNWLWKGSVSAKQRVTNNKYQNELSIFWRFIWHWWD
jgi:hypothetical protein